MKNIVKIIALTLLTIMALTCFAGCGQKADGDLAYVKEKGELVVGITDFAPMDYKDENGNRCLLCEVENNFQRVNELSFQPINTDEIYVELKKTHGQPFYSVYEIRCY